GIGAADARLIDRVDLPLHRDGARPPTGAGVGIHRIIHGATAVAATGGVYPTVGSAGRPSAAAGGSDIKATTLSACTAVATPRTYGIGAADARLIDRVDLPLHRDGARTPTGAGVGLNLVIHDATAVAATGGVYPTVGGAGRPSAAAGGNDIKATTLSARSAVATPRTYGIGAADARLID